MGDFAPQDAVLRIDQRLFNSTRSLGVRSSGGLKHGRDNQGIKRLNLYVRDVRRLGRLFETGILQDPFVLEVDQSIFGDFVFRFVGGWPDRKDLERFPGKHCPAILIQNAKPEAIDSGHQRIAWNDQIHLVSPSGI